jgi:hypothetical protein
LKLARDVERHPTGGIMSTEEFKESLLQKSAENLAKKPRASKTDIGAKVYVKLPKSKELTPAIVVETAYMYHGPYKQCRIKIAQYSHLSCEWVISIYRKPVQSDKLKVRKEVIAALDCPEEAQ